LLPGELDQGKHRNTVTAVLIRSRPERLGEKKANIIVSSGGPQITVQTSLLDLGKFQSQDDSAISLQSMADNGFRERGGFRSPMDLTKDDRSAIVKKRLQVRDWLARGTDGES
jgi:hypothetical protein